MTGSESIAVNSFISSISIINIMKGGKRNDREKRTVDDNRSD